MSEPTTPPPAFAETLPADIRNEAAFKDIKSLDDLAKSYLNAQRMIGVPAERLLRLPDSDDPKAWEPLWSRLGRPEAPDKYDLKVPQGVAADDKLLQGFKAWAHEAGLNQRQAATVFERYATSAAELSRAQQESTAQAKAAALQELKTEWGAAFDKNINDARRALQHYGDEKLVQDLQATGMADNPSLVRTLAKLGAQLREDGLVRGTPDPSDGALSPAEAKQQIAAMQTDPAAVKALLDKSHPRHAEFVQKRAELFAYAHPSA